MDYPDYYALLGVPVTASSEQIRKAYRKLVRRYHPDHHQNDPEAEERLKQINEAFEVLSDAQRRHNYDQLIRGYIQWQQQPMSTNVSPWTSCPPPAPTAGRPTADSLDDSDIVDDYLRHSASYAPRHRSAEHRFGGQDLELCLQITLEDAYRGTQRLIETGARSIQVIVPRGIHDGGRIRLDGLGSLGYVGGQAGDLYILVEVLEHPVFRRTGDDLHLDIGVDLYTALLGGTIMIPTMTGEAETYLQPGAQPGTMVRLRGYGMPCLKNPNMMGDLYAHLQIQLPTELTAEEVRLFEHLRALRS